MNIIYVYHSCYVIETDESFLLFDYFKDSGASPVRGYVHDELLRQEKPLYVFASHFHPDHFNPDILHWRKEKRNIVYLLSADILQHGRAVSGDGIFLDKGDTYHDDLVSVETFGSTDAGGSFLVEAGGRLMFHAGDLNNWHWKEESTPEEVEEAERAYLAELEQLAGRTQHLFLSMFPVDPRLGADYMRGAEQFVSRIRTDYLAPMHFAEAYDKAAAFRAYAGAHHCLLLPVAHKGESFKL